MPSITITISVGDLNRILAATGYVSGNQTDHVRGVLRKHVVGLVRAFEQESALETFTASHVPPDVT